MKSLAMAVGLMALLMALLTMGCVSGGTPQITEPGTVAKIEAGKSTKADVSALLGEPAKVEFSGEQEVWTYVHVRGTPRAAAFIPVVGIFAGGADLKTTNLTIRFNKAGIVTDIGKGSFTAGGGSVGD